MKKLLVITSLLLLCTANLAHAGCSTTGSNGEVKTLEIFRNIFGPGMNGDDLFLLSSSLMSTDQEGPEVSR